jgi:hypothetical protein
MAWRKNIVMTNWIRNKVERGTRRVWTLTKRLQTSQEGRMGIRDLGDSRPRYLRKLMERTRGNCGSLEQLVASRIRMTHCAKLARCKEHEDREDIRGVQEEGFRAGVREASIGMSSGLRKMRNWTLWRGRPPPERKIKDWALSRGRPPPKREENPTSSVRRAGYVGAPATPKVMAHRGKDKRKEKEKLLMMVRSWNNWNLIREPLGTSWP